MADSDLVLWAREAAASAMADALVTRARSVAAPMLSVVVTNEADAAGVVDTVKLLNQGAKRVAEIERQTLADLARALEEGKAPFLAARKALADGARAGNAALAQYQERVLRERRAADAKAAQERIAAAAQASQDQAEEVPEAVTVAAPKNSVVARGGKATAIASRRLHAVLVNPAHCPAHWLDLRETDCTSAARAEIARGDLEVPEDRDEQNPVMYNGCALFWRLHGSVR